MRSDRRPPALATWLLRHFTARYQRDALIGDLIEEHARGRSALWYWRQTLLAMMAAARTALPRITLAGLALLLYSSLWVALALLLKSPMPLFCLLDPLFIISRRERRRRGAEAARRAAQMDSRTPGTP